MLVRTGPGIPMIGLSRPENSIIQTKKFNFCLCVVHTGVIADSEGLLIVWNSYAVLSVSPYIPVPPRGAHVNLCEQHICVTGTFSLASTVCTSGGSQFGVVMY